MSQSNKKSYAQAVNHSPTQHSPVSPPLYYPHITGYDKNDHNNGLLNSNRKTGVTNVGISNNAPNQ